jgi:hypothetical protein
MAKKNVKSTESTVAVFRLRTDCQKNRTLTMFLHIAVDQMNAQSLVLAQLATQYGVDTQHGKDPNAAAAQAIKAQLIQAQKDLASITAQKAQVQFFCLLHVNISRGCLQVCQYAKHTGVVHCESNA